MKRIIFAIFVLSAGLAITVPAQTPEVKPINGGVLNGKAISLPKPVYPDEARIARVGGSVPIQVTIDEGGNVIAASRVTKAQSTDDSTPAKAEARRLRGLLEDAAEQAAWQSRFAPTMLSGNPVKVTGVVIYNFAPAGNDANERPGAGPGSGVKSINGGVLNGKATSLPRPAYPPAARAVKAEGPVSVQVLVDENGDVISAAAISGHPVLQAAAVNAARQAKFAPTLLQGQPVKVSGVITYNFVAGKPEN